MDTFRNHWPDVELDLVSGFHADPVELLDDDSADLVIVSRQQSRRGIAFSPLFRYEIPALLAKQHPLIERPYLEAEDFADQTLITYPVPDDRLDVVRDVLRPAGINPVRRTTALTVAILQLVASRRGVAALPRWAVQPYLDNGYVVARPITAHGFRGNLYAATTTMTTSMSYMQAFIHTMKDVSFATLNGARFLGRDKEIGTVEPGKRADLVLVEGDAVRDPTALRRMPLVFKNGVGYRTQVLIDGAKEQVGLN